MKKRILAVDLGKKRIGLAITDPLNIIAQPFQTIEFKGKTHLAKQLIELVAEKQIGTIVFGVPITLSGNESKKTKEILKLVDELRELLPDDLLIDTIDESLTTVEAHQILHQMGKKPSKNKDRVDQIAAQRMLQSYMGNE